MQKQEINNPMKLLTFEPNSTEDSLVREYKFYVPGERHK